MLILSEAHEQDAERLFRLYCDICRVREDLGFEIGKATIQEFAELLCGTSKRRAVYFIAQHEQTDIGLASIQGHASSEMAHLASCSIGLREQWRGKGFGKMILKDLEEWSMEHQLLRIETCIDFDNRAALLLFGTSGYRVEGIRKSAFMRDGKLKDGFYMAKQITAQNEETK
ncbi:GNAT family N-acetyltransferase [Sporolactobacillus shoreicorticis]|uniref:GNAT family N-acetyltransferase n=1 Tax=Sporolactobacillus shoreicorticis TaxID=1923877 RepID=A0ABW5S5T4_9BACL|nr:GNAT family protein [Sporolactobacillus shoreicorticis]MCO7126275.1 GNAT family N-acetyltransferase [Sporolactobacillus shoreicorticis]